jgi:hypothetical protein
MRRANMNARGRRRQHGSMDRIALTPGRLYARLAAEYRRVRPAHCGNCRMPMVALAHRTHPDGPNWTTEPLQALCDKCRPLIAAIIHQAMEEFDLRDPTAVPFLPPTAPPRPHLPAGRH